MKFTHKYIAMVSASTEIQVLRGQYAGPNYEFGCQGRVSITYGEGFDIVHIPENHPYWLPSLDQLMGMIGDVWDFESKSRSLSYEESFEQETDTVLEWHEYALTIIMKDKHGKSWNGKEWVKLLAIQHVKLANGTEI